MDQAELRAAIEAEGRERFEFDEAVEWFIHYAATQWRYGDGRGGFVFAALHDAWEAHYPERAARNRVADTFKKRTISGSLRTQVYERDAYRCKRCGTWERLSVDHIVPESRGGPTELDNLQTLCRSCNSSKGTK